MKKYSTELQAEILKRPKWEELVKQNKFNESKALISLKVSTSDIKKISPRKYSDLLKIESPTLATIKKYHLENVTELVVENLVRWLRDSFTSEKKINDFQVELICEMILEDFSHFTIADFKLCFKNGLKGLYGGSYQMLDVTRVYDWLGKYFTERTAVIRAINEKNKRQKEKEIEIDEVAVKKIYSSLNQVISKKKEDVKTKEKKYISIESWCKNTGRDFNKTNEQLLFKFNKDWKEIKHDKNKEVKKEDYLTWRFNLYLVKINNKQKEDGKK